MSAGQKCLIPQDRRVTVSNMGPEYRRAIGGSGRFVRLAADRAAVRSVYRKLRKAGVHPITARADVAALLAAGSWCDFVSPYEGPREQRS